MKPMRSLSQLDVVQRPKKFPNVSRAMGRERRRKLSFLGKVDLENPPRKG